MTDMTLYQIADAREILDTWLLETEGEVTPELEALLAEIDGKADEKIERVALYIREQLALATAAGKPFLGMPTRKSKVVIVDYENSPVDSHWMLEQQRKHLGLVKYPAGSLWSTMAAASLCCSPISI